MGLHTIDTIRRDAAEQKIWFDTELLPDQNKTQVALTYDENRLVYTIDMVKDVVEEITFATSNGPNGNLRFDYLQEIDDMADKFVQPRVKPYGKTRPTKGVLWLTDLAAKLAEQDK